VKVGNCDNCGRWGARRASGFYPYPALCSRCLPEWERTRAELPVRPTGYIRKLQMEVKNDKRGQSKKG
jgi:hypothetical protein